MNYFWPSMDSTYEANRACGAASGISFFVAAVTAAVAWLQMSGKINIFPGIGVMAYIDAGLFFCVGVGLCFHSRIAAVSGLVLYIIERFFMIKTYGLATSQVVSLLIFGVSFVNGVRGTFAWHILRKAELAGAGDVSSSPPKQVSSKKNNINLIRPLILLVVLAGVAIAAFYYLKSTKEAVSAYEQMNQKLKIAQAHLPKMPSPPLVAPKGEIVKLVLKTGRKFEGVLVKKNSDGYWLFIEGTGEVFFSAGEIKEIS